MATAAAATPISGRKAKPIGEFVPVYVALGMILVSASLGAHTIYTQLSYNPSVRLNKKRRETVLEVEDPERVAEEGVGYINHSIFRKVAHKQDFDAVRAGISDPMRAKDVCSIGESEVRRCGSELACRLRDAAVVVDGGRWVEKIDVYI
ncbi:hypothetical protein KSP40_PGU011790 [Platanthera guangdongensis]|uniref:Uncharacterized protein n=1 Tax=Platanthera guangdongensis TaxID=2320717 RepID=A0ABR2N3B5_9ASPA